MYLVCVAGDGVLRRRLDYGPDQKHQRELSEGGVDRIRLQRDPQGENRNEVHWLFISMKTKCFVDLILKKFG